MTDCCRTRLWRRRGGGGGGLDVDRGRQIDRYDDMVLATARSEIVVIEGASLELKLVLDCFVSEGGIEDEAFDPVKLSREVAEEESKGDKVMEFIVEGGGFDGGEGKEAEADASQSWRRGVWVGKPC